MQRTQHIHRIMANYMPHNQRSGGAAGAWLGFEKEGYAKDYLLIDGQRRDHVLTALTTPDAGLRDVKERMKYQLTAHEARVIGCLLESRSPPRQYPLSVKCCGDRLQSENQPRASDGR